MVQIVHVCMLHHLPALALLQVALLSQAHETNNFYRQNDILIAIVYVFRAIGRGHLEHGNTALSNDVIILCHFVLLDPWAPSPHAPSCTSQITVNNASSGVFLPLKSILTASSSPISSLFFVLATSCECGSCRPHRGRVGTAKVEALGSHHGFLISTAGPIM